MGFFDNFNWGEAAMGFFADPEVTAARMKRRREEETAKRLRSALEGRGVPQADIDLMLSSPGAASSYIGKMVEPKDPYLPSTEKEAQWYEQNGDPATAADIRAKARMVPVQQADPNTGEVRYQYVRPTVLMGGGSAPSKPPQPGTVEDGYMFKGGDPADPSSWVPVNGGAGPSAPRMFPRPY